MGNEWGIFLFYIAIFKNKNKRIFVPYGFQQVFNIQIYTNIQIYKCSFQHFNIVFNKFSTFQQHHNNFPTSYQQFSNKLSTSKKLLFLKINFFCATNNSTSHQLINKKNKKREKNKKKRIEFLLSSLLLFASILYCTTLSVTQQLKIFYFHSVLHTYYKHLPSLFLMPYYQAYC